MRNDYRMINNGSNNRTKRIETSEEENKDDYTVTRQIDSADSDKTSKKKRQNSKYGVIIGTLSVVVVLLILIILGKGDFFNNTGNCDTDNSSNNYVQSNIVEFEKKQNVKKENGKKIKASVLGMGGGGALFEPLISPHNSNNMLVMTDMGGVYISGDKGEHWSRRYLNGICLSATYDPKNEDVLYVGGNGLYRSVDNGKNFEMIFPNKNDLVAKLTHNENGLQYFITKSKKYDYTKHVKSIVIDPDDSKHIFTLLYNYGEGFIYESKDNGKDFNKLFEYTKATNDVINYDFNELVYKRESKCLYLINDECVIEYNLKTKKQKTVYTSNYKLVDVASVYEDGKTYFIIIEETEGQADSKSKVFYTNDFKKQVDITSKITAAAPTSFNDDYFGNLTYQYDFTYIAATSLDNIYVTNYASAQAISIGSVIRLSKGKAKVLYGKPSQNRETLSSRGWCDGYLLPYGIAASKQNEEEFLVSTEVSLYYGADSDHIYARYCTSVGDSESEDVQYVTNGIDVQASYKVCEDPFNKKNMLVLNTDFGLIKSTNRGKSWYRANEGIPELMQNTIYDAVYDKYKKNIIYSIWSAHHNAPLEPNINSTYEEGRFAISRDGGDTWDANYSSGIPDRAIPCKMSVVYPGKSKIPTIYVATFNYGFYVSKDGGKTFKEMNGGLPTRQYQDNNYILAADIEVADGHIYGLIAKSWYNEEIQPCELYEYIDGSWKQVKLPENAKTVRDICYKKDTLYITGIATSIWDYKNNVDFNNYGGGLYAYKNGEFTQIFKENLSTTSVQVDSKGTIFVSDIEGNIYRKPAKGEFKKIYNHFHYISKNLHLSEDDDRLYLTTFGGGVLKLENLKSLY